MITEEEFEEKPTRVTRRVYFGALALVCLLVTVIVLVQRFGNPRAPAPAQQAAVACPDPAGLSIAGKVSERDSSGALVGETLESVSIRARAPTQMHIGVEYAIDWTMQGTATTFMMYAAHSQGTTLHPAVTALPSTDEFETRVTFPKSGCWQLHVSRGADAGNVWVIVDP